jgi:Asp-tRNA(Asn)/Glu-tRNA(Gln) amidotransferase C subunit
MSLTPDQLQRIALLARIDVSAEEAQGVAERLNRVLASSTSCGGRYRGFEPMSHALTRSCPPAPAARCSHRADRRDDYQRARRRWSGLYRCRK